MEARAKAGVERRRLVRLVKILALMVGLCPSLSLALEGLAAVNVYGGGWYDADVDLVIVECATMTPHTIVHGGTYGPCISPDGRQVAYIKNRNSIRISNIDGTGDHEIAANIGFSGEAGTALSWLPDGSIMWGAGSGINKVNSDGSGREHLCNMGDELIGVTFSDDGTRGAGFTYAWRAFAFDVCGGVKWYHGGCQGSISPSGRYSTHNQDHNTFHIRDFATGNIVQSFNSGVCGGGNLNNHKFSRHSDDWVMFTVCKSGSNGCPDDWDGSAEAWLVDRRNSQGYKIGDKMKAWDYHPAAAYGPAEPPEATEMTATPNSTSIEFNKTKQFTATVVDQFGNPMETQPEVTWEVTGSQNTVDAGLVSVGSEAGDYTVTATSGEFTATAGFSVVAYAPVDIKINCGGNAVSGTDWVSDQEYAEGGDPYSFDITADVAGATDPAPSEVYGTVRHMNHSYAFDVPDGDYTVRLHFVDAVEDDGRAMDYTIEGEQVITGMSIIQEAGGVARAMVKEFRVTVEDGELNVDGSQGTGNDVFEAGLEVLRVPPETVAFGHNPALSGVAPSRAFVVSTNGNCSIAIGSIGHHMVRVFSARGECVFERRGTQPGAYTFRPEVGGFYVVRVVSGGNTIDHHVVLP